MENPTNEFHKIVSDAALGFDPETARAVCRQCNEALILLNEIWKYAQRLSDVGSAGNFMSAQNIQKALAELATVFMNALKSMIHAMTEMRDAVRQAGLRITDQDEENARHLASNSDTARGYPKVGSGSTSPSAKSGDPRSLSAPVAGRFPCDVTIEAAAGALTDWGYSMSQPAETDKVRALGQNWLQVTRDLDAVMGKFHTETDKLFQDGSWTGTAKDAIRSGMQGFVDTSDKVVEQAFTNGRIIDGWSRTVENNKLRFTELKKMLDDAKESSITAGSTIAYAAFAKKNADIEQWARAQITSTYNPGVAAAGTRLGNIPDPQSPVGALVPMALPGQPVGSKGATSFTKPMSAGAPSAPGPGGTGSSGAGSSKSSSSAGSAQLTRAANADAVAKDAAAKSAVAQQAAAAKVGAGSPASAAQSVASQVAQAGKGLSGVGQGGVATKSAGALANAEKAAAERAAKAAAGLGKGGGGGAGGGMGGAAAAEKALQARAGSMGAAEKMVAAEQAALQNGRAGSPGMSGAPMGGARPGGEGGEGKGHKAARYLNSKANGEEIVGVEQEVAPTVIGGLNLDTTDDRPVRGGGTPPRR